MNRTTPLRLIGATLLILVVAGVLAAGMLFYKSYTTNYVVTAEDDGQAITRVVDARLDTAGDLRVSLLRGTVQSVAHDARLGGLLNSSRVMKAPFEVGYFVDLSGLDRGDFFWDAKSRTLTVKVPDVRVDPVNVDEARTTLDETSGIFVSRAAMAELRHRASAGAQRSARAEAVKPANLERARENGRQAITALFARPLRIAGIDATVRVQYAGQPAADPTIWDRSRSLAELYAP
jgi:hypothetical protein